MKERKCLDCGKTFVPKKGIQKYCSSNCRTSSKFKRMYELTPGYYPKNPNKKVKLKRGRKLIDEKKIQQREYKR